MSAYGFEIVRASGAGGLKHAFRRGLATNLHVLGVDDKTIQAILRHSNIAITQNIYIKSVTELQVSAMDTLSENLGTCNDLATNPKGPVN